MPDEFADAIAKTLGLEGADDSDNNDTDADVDVNDDKDTDQDDKNKDVDDGADDKNTDDGGADDNTGDTDDQKDKKKVLPNDDKADDTAGVEFETLLSEKSGGKFKSYTDVEKALEEAPENAFANEMVKKLNEYVKSGGEATDFLRTQTVDFSKMNDLDAIREVESMSDGGLTREEIEILLEEEYGYSEDATDREKTLAKIKIKRAGENARKQLLEYQQRWAVPKVDKAEIEAANREESEKWQQELSTAVDSNPEMVFQLGDEEFKYTPSDDMKKTVKDAYDLTKFWTRYAKEGGGYDVNKFVQDMHFLNNRDDIIKSVFTFAKGKGTEEIVDDLKNPGFKGADVKDKDGKIKPLEEQVGDVLFG